jgi:L-ascorbate metabolism protein UlaG (beta-lactamase superfamily)
MPKLYYQGHGSYRITSNSGVVIYVDPYAGIGYEDPADLILVTHQHQDHNQINLCAKKKNCQIITNFEALRDGHHQSFNVLGVDIEAVEAYNDNHDITQCVGYLIRVDGILIYASGDTSKTKQMRSFNSKKIDYALFPLDGIYNMSLLEGEEVAKIVGASHNIPIHLKPQALFDFPRAKHWRGRNKLIIKPNEELNLVKKEQSL